MTQNLMMIFPMAAMFLLTAVVLLVMFKRRVVALKSGVVRMSVFRTREPKVNGPEQMLKAEAHFENLFEVPVLFYVACLMAMFIPVFGIFLTISAWGYVVCRILHAIIHMGGNNILHRSKVYGLGWIFLLAMWVHIVVKVISFF